MARIDDICELADVLGRGGFGVAEARQRVEGLPMMPVGARRLSRQTLFGTETFAVSAEVPDTASGAQIAQVEAPKRMRWLWPALAFALVGLGVGVGAALWPKDEVALVDAVEAAPVMEQPAMEQPAMEQPAHLAVDASVDAGTPFEAVELPDKPNLGEAVTIFETFVADEPEAEEPATEEPVATRMRASRSQSMSQSQSM